MYQTIFDLHSLDKQLSGFWTFAKTARVLAFSGAMAAGKTTFISALCHFLGVEDAVSSPTFALINEYRLPVNAEKQKIYHMDWYRLSGSNEAIQAGMEDALNDDTAYCFVEWPEKAPEILPAGTVLISLATLEDGRRSLTAQFSN